MNSTKAQEHQRILIQGCVKNNMNVKDTISFLKNAYHADCLSERTIYRWHRDFAKNWRESSSDKPRTGRPTDSCTDENIKLIKELIYEDKRISLRELAEQTALSYGTVQRINAFMPKASILKRRNKM